MKPNVDTASSATIYQPLEGRGIRLLQIRPSEDFKADIQCSLQTVTLDDTPTYVALSYEWGPPFLDQNAIRVFVNTVEIDATTNLRLALQYLRQPFEDQQMLWIDAICINQADQCERGHQVRLMRDIYQKAAKVIAWLGAAKGDEDYGMALITKFCEIWSSAQDYRKRVSPEILIDKEIEELTHKAEEELVTRAHFDPAFRRLWMGWVQIVDSSYWKRLWIIQEILVNEQVEVRRGSTSVPLVALNVVSDTFYTHTVRATESAPDGAAMELIHHVFKNTTALRLLNSILGHSKGTDSLLTLLRRTSESLCKDPRDRVYALLGIALLPKYMSFPIDYQAPVHQVYLDTARYIIEGCGDLIILSHCRKKSNMETPLPSWVPDWRQYLGSFVPEHDEKPSGQVHRKLSSYNNYAVISPDGYRLKITAVVLGELDGFQAGDGSDSRADLARHLSRCLDFAREVLQEWGVDETAQRSVVLSLYETILFPIGNRRGREQVWPVESFTISMLTEGGNGGPEEHSFRSTVLREAFESERSLCSIALSDGRQRILGACPSNSKLGDVVVIVQGCPSPLILRPRGDVWELISDMFVYGYMNGEATGKFPLSEFTLV